jgi:concanavalin A-like lectin/glucanase superfamily protein
MGSTMFGRIGRVVSLALVAACSSNIEFAPVDSMRPLEPDNKPPPGDGGLGLAGSGGSGGSALDASTGGDILPVLPPPGGSGPTDGDSDQNMPPVVPTPCADDDADGRCNADDRCPAIANQDDAADADGDGVPDACDRCNGARVALLAKAPLFYFPFDEAVGSTAAQNLGSVAVTGQYVGPVVLGLGGVADPRGSALRIPGDSATFPRVAALNVPEFPSTALSAMFWVKSSQAEQYGVISYALVDSANEFSVFVDGDLLRLDFEDLTFEQDLDVSTRISDGTWHFVAVTWADTVAQVYFDGEAVGAPMSIVYANAVQRFPTPDPGAAIDLTPGGVLIFGQDQDSLNGGFATTQALNGGLDELAIFDRALSGDEIREIFTATTCGERCDGLDNDQDGTADEGFQGSAPACAAPSCQSIEVSGSAFGTGTYFLQRDPNAPVNCVFP